jgi:hypothetical protein
VEGVEGAEKQARFAVTFQLGRRRSSARLDEAHKFDRVVQRPALFSSVTYLVSLAAETGK